MEEEAFNYYKNKRSDYDWPIVTTVLAVLVN
jgi:hypothetical protein